MRFVTIDGRRSKIFCRGGKAQRRRPKKDVADRAIGRGLRVNTVSLGTVATSILTEFRQIFGDPRAYDDITRVGRAGLASDVGPASFLR